MKRILCIIALFCLVITFYACGKQKADSSNETKPISQTEEQTETEQPTATTSYVDYFISKICVVKEINGTVLTLAELDEADQTKTVFNQDYGKLENAEELLFRKGETLRVTYRIIENGSSSDSALYSIEKYDL